MRQVLALQNLGCHLLVLHGEKSAVWVFLATCLQCKEAASPMQRITRLPEQGIEDSATMHRSPGDANQTLESRRQSGCWESGLEMISQLLFEIYFILYYIVCIWWKCPL